MSVALDLIDRARADADSIARHLLGEPNPRLSSRSELRWGEHGKLALALAGPHKGKWRDWSADNAHGDTLDLIERELSADRRAALEWLHRWYGGSVAPIDHEARARAARAAQEQADKQDEARARAARDMWEKAVPFAGTPAETYLRNRMCGVDIPAPVYDGEALRWHPGLRSLNSNPVPGAIGAMVAAMTDPVTNDFRGVHRTFVGERGDRLARGMLGDKGVCRLWPDDAVTTGLAVGEGIESTLSAVLLLDLPPAWAALDAGNLAKFPVLGGVEVLHVAADNDPQDRNGRQAGQAASRQCAERWRDAEREVRIHTPRAGDSDFNNMLRQLAGNSEAA